MYMEYEYTYEKSLTLELHISVSWSNVFSTLNENHCDLPGNQSGNILDRQKSQNISTRIDIPWFKLTPSVFW